ncbi:Dihydrofolate reductase type 3 [Rubrivivax sp. A210]|uniref:dihydrofolate reductase n=1 Tax=Rubrivivax sp. A210 TaxID=2772301 RepID=UPI001919DACC|nr:dihydrofolate reductase [Rubrivivax sp. A210]CAD5371923.1 Dihydrofolate reductase type 3 [Rubrivivax sp. A210]
MGAGPELVLIAAVARNGAIGRHNDLIFGDPADLRQFRTLTMGCPVLMGRKTWQSLPARFRPLPGRQNIVLSRDPGFTAPGAQIAPGLDEALALAGAAARVFVIGGGQLYAGALPRAAELRLTEVAADLHGDTWFPAWNRADFVETERVAAPNPVGPAFDFVCYRRR